MAPYVRARSRPRCYRRSSIETFSKVWCLRKMTITAAVVLVWWARISRWSVASDWRGGHTNPVAAHRWHVLWHTPTNKTDLYTSTGPVDHRTEREVEWWWSRTDDSNANTIGARWQCGGGWVGNRYTRATDTPHASSCT